MAPASRTSSQLFDERLRRGIRALELNRYDDAFDLFKQAQELAWLRPEPWFWMGRTHEDLGDRERAARCYQMALSMGHGYDQARFALRRLGYLNELESAYF